MTAAEILAVGRIFRNIFIFNFHLSLGFNVQDALTRKDVLDLGFF